MLELLNIGGGKKTIPKLQWELMPAVRAGHYFVRINSDGWFANLAGTINSPSMYSLPDQKQLGSASYTNNLQTYNESYLFSTKTVQPATTRLYSLGGQQSGNPTKGGYRLQISGNSYQTSSMTPNAITARMYLGCTGTHGLADVGGYVYGGLNGATVFSDMYKVAETGVTAFTYTGAPGPRQSQAMCHHADIGLWMFGGARTGSNATNTRELWHMPEGTNAWELVTPLGEVLPEVFNPGMVAYGGNIYIWGGVNKSGALSNKTYRYNVATNTVTELAILIPTTAFSCIHSFMFEDFIFSTNAQGQVIRMRV